LFVFRAHATESVFARRRRRRFGLTIDEPPPATPASARR
jgi:hypothetical protein